MNANCYSRSFVLQRARICCKILPWGKVVTQFPGWIAAARAGVGGAHPALQHPLPHQMAKAAPSKKTAKAAKSASTGGKKKAHRKGKETFNSYIHKVLKQVHPGALAAPRAPPRPAEGPAGHPAFFPPLPHE